MESYYALYVRHEVYETLQSVGRDARVRIRALFESLANNPFQSSDRIVINESGRPSHVKVVGKYTVYYWIDHAGKEVKILDLVDTGTS
jgi:thioesterase domain-containing protein